MEVADSGINVADGSIVPHFETGIFSYRQAEFSVSSDTLGVVITETGTCKPYSGMDGAFDDVAWKVAALTQLGSWFIAVILISNLGLASCCSCTDWYFRGIGVAFWCVVCVLDGVLFWAMRSDLCNANNPALREQLDTVRYEPSPCEFGTTAWFVVGSVIGYFLTGFLCFMVVQMSDTKASTNPASTETKLVDSDDMERNAFFMSIFFCFRKKDDASDEEIGNNAPNDEDKTQDVTRDSDGMVVLVEIDDDVDDFVSAAAESDNNDEQAETNVETTAEVGANVETTEEAGANDKAIVEDDWDPFEESLEVDVGLEGAIKVEHVTSGVGQTENHSVLSGSFGAYS